MASDVNGFTLADLATFRNGKALSPSEYSPTGRHPVFGANGIIAHTNLILNEHPVITIGRVGAYCGAVYQIMKPSWVTDNAIIAEPKPGVDIRYLYCTLSNLHLNRTSIGSAQPLLTQAGLRVIRVQKPPLAIQERIGEILGALDDKIELNRRANETLERIARAIFRSWFVEFGAPANAAGGTVVRPSAAIGALPHGWQMRPLSSLATFRNGLPMQRYAARPGEPSLPVIKISELRNGPTESSDRANLDVPPEYVVDDGDLLFSWSGSLEVLLWTHGRGALNQHLFHVVCDRGLPSWYVMHALLLHLPGFRSIASSKATTMGHIQRYHLEQALVTTPPPDLLRDAGIVMQPVMDLFVAKAVENRRLAETRDALLPRLLSGDLSPRTVESEMAP